jgi:hypothetical protein
MHSTDACCESKVYGPTHASRLLRILQGGFHIRWFATGLEENGVVQQPERRKVIAASSSSGGGTFPPLPTPSNSFDVSLKAARENADIEIEL